MNEGVDTGDILLCSKLPIGENDTTEEMFDKLSEVGAEVMLETLELCEKGLLNPVAQNEDEATHVGLLSKELSPVDWNDTALNIHNKIRGLYSWPCAQTSVSGKTLKIYSSIISDIKGNNKPGSVIDNSSKLVVCCGDNKCIELKSVQLEGKKRMDTAAFLNGFKIEKGTVLG